MKNKKTNDEKNAKKLALIEKRKQKKEAAKAKREAKKAARLEKIEKQRAKKRAIREEKKMKRLVRIEKEKAKKAAIREKKRLAREKKLAAEAAKKAKAKDRVKKENSAVSDAIDIKEAIKAVKKYAKDIAKNYNSLTDKEIKKVKNIGFDIDSTSLKFLISIPIKGKNSAIDDDVAIDADVVDETVDVQPNESQDDKPTSVDTIPAGDLLGTDGQVNDAEVANIDEDDEADDNDDDIFNANDDFFSDSRDEQDEDLVENRKEFFGNFDDEGEEATF